jgi:hypothetical protein
MHGEDESRNSEQRHLVEVANIGSICVLDIFSPSIVFVQELAQDACWCDISDIRRGSLPSLFSLYQASRVGDHACCLGDIRFESHGVRGHGIGVA